MPPSYDYHLKFELYPSPDPTAGHDDTSGAKDLQIWQPVPGASIFDELPCHSVDDAEAKDPLPSTEPSAAIGGGRHGNTATHCGSDDDGEEHTGGDNSHSSGNFVRLSERQWRNRAYSVPAPGFAAGLGPETATRDWRFGRLRIESLDMESTEAPAATTNEEVRATPAASLGPTFGGDGKATRARYNPLATRTTNAGWGIVHLYREAGNPPLYENSVIEEDSDGRDGTILCIPAVPSYLTPSDFLGFIGEAWRDDVSHYRMVMTSRINRYMVLLKFRDAGRAREWRAAFDGRVFNSMESEICHVTFIKSITFETPGHPAEPPGRSRGKEHEDATASSSFSNSLRPFPPPTPNLIEMPTCTVCLERMDDTTGLVTILCQHVFHCTCLQTWKGSGCPVCRATNPSPAKPSAADGGQGASVSAGTQSTAYDPNNQGLRPFGAGGVSNLCSVCDCSDDLWICLICAYVGCGRYKRGHAKDHWKETAHSFSLELETQHIWDYAGDIWVHRLIRDKGDGKVVELPGRRPSHGHGWLGRSRAHGGGGQDEGDSDEEEEDVVPRAKVDLIDIEYTHLLTSQLESQRVYFEGMVKKAADKAAKATAAAEAANTQAAEAMSKLRSLEDAYQTLAGTAVPTLERDMGREKRRAEKASELARGLGKSLQEEKKVSEGLMTRIKHMQEQVTTVQGQLAAAQAKNAELQDTNRDLSMFISGQEKLRELEAEGRVNADEVAEGTVSVPEDKKGKGKGRARKR